MARHDDAVALLKRGNSPSAIAKHWEASYYSVSQDLIKAVGRGLIYRSEILFTISSSTKRAVLSVLSTEDIRNRWELKTVLTRPGRHRTARYDLDDALLFFDLKDAPMADTYELLCRTEQHLHTYIKTTLAPEGETESFWRKLPLSVREDCVHSKENDEDPHQDPYCYTTFVHLKIIFDKNWATLSKGLPKAVANDKTMFLKTLQTLNSIRNRVMHPVRGREPSSAEFEHVSTFLHSVLQR